jgi:cell wall-associated NlpC family hydrolase
LLLLSSNYLQNSATPSSPNRFFHIVTRKTASIFSLALAGLFAISPLSSQARVPAAQRAAQHNARIAKLMALHEDQIIAKRAKTIQRLAKLEDQHEALMSGNVVEAAYAFRGSRYVMGGTSRSGFDCSGFVRYILSNADGVDLPRTAVDQFYHGAPIAPKDMQAGDLVFFKNTYKHGISHVGIYAGNGKFIHAANAHKGVRMDSLSDRYYVAHFAGARRVLPAQMRELAYLH